MDEDTGNGQVYQYGTKVRDRTPVVGGEEWVDSERSRRDGQTKGWEVRTLGEGPGSGFE